MNYVLPLQEGMDAKSLVNPYNIFSMNADVMKKMKTYEEQYERYMRCQDKNIKKNVTPSCDFNGIDSYSNLENAYSDLLASLKTVSAVVPNQSKINATTPQDSDKNYKNAIENHDNIVSTRAALDKRLQMLYNEANGGPESAQQMLNSAIYANTLWTILATCLLYYIFVEL
jgi:hypothetical protein